MTVSPKKKNPCNYTSANRGVEAKEIEIASINLECAARGVGAPYSPPSRDDSASYIQVLVQKRHRLRDAVVTPRLPRPSSPASAALSVRKPSPASNPTINDRAVCPPTLTRCLSHPHIQAQGHAELRGASAACGAWPGALLACPALAALHRSCGEQSAAGDAPPLPPLPPKCKRDSLWRRVRGTKEDFGSLDSDAECQPPQAPAVSEPARLDVYRFVGDGATLSARGAAPTRLERALRRGARRAARLLAEVLAAPRLLASLPAALLPLVLQTALAPARDASVGLVQTASDYVLKPALALAFNALVQPALVFAAQVGGALREALRPLALALGDAVEPAARLLAAARLVQVERRCSCAQTV